MWKRNSVYLIYRKYYLYYDHYGILGIDASVKEIQFFFYLQYNNVGWK